jgi:hypothetical protein
MSLFARPRALSALAFASLLALPLVGCGYGGDDDHDRYDDGYDYGPAASCSDTVEEAIIDTDELLDVQAGDGAGTFVEYEAGGTYHITTSCDADNGGDCLWDILVTPVNGEIVSAAPGDLEGDDALTFRSGDQLQLVAQTGRDFDGFVIQTEPGATLEIDALLDGGCGNRYLFWVGDGALHSGAPTNPMRLTPSAP